MYDIVPLYIGSYGNKGCSGGDTISVFKYIIANGGVDTASYYPYKAQVRVPYITSPYSSIVLTDACI